MKKVIHHIRRQPEGVKRQILHLATGVFAFILFSLWLYSLGVKIDNQAQKTVVRQEPGPISAITENLIDGYKSISTDN